MDTTLELSPEMEYLEGSNRARRIYCGLLARGEENVSPLY